MVSPTLLVPHLWIIMTVSFCDDAARFLSVRVAGTNWTLHVGESDVVRMCKRYACACVFLCVLLPRARVPSTLWIPQ